MKYRKLGRQGPQVSALGLGCMSIGIHDVYTSSVDDDEGAVALIHRALDLGITLLDSADVYGDSERQVGKALQGGRRDKIVLATKFGFTTGVSANERRGAPESMINGSPQYVKQACDASLQRLGVDYIDLYYLHRVDPKTPIEIRWSGYTGTWVRIPPSPPPIFPYFSATYLILAWGYWRTTATHTPAVGKRGNRKSGTTSQSGRVPKVGAVVRPTHVRGVFAVVYAEMRNSHPSGSRPTRKREQCAPLLVETPGSHEPQTRLGTRRRPRQTVSMARLSQGETQPGEGSAQGRIVRSTADGGRAATAGLIKSRDF